MRQGLLIAALVFSASCVARHQQPPQPTRGEQLLEAVTRAQVAASSGQREEADRILARFVDANPSTPEAREAAYWRAILQLESGASQANRERARRELAAYLADTTARVHAIEARIIRHLLTAVDSTSKATDSTSTAARQAATAREEELKKEIQSLKDQLEKTNEELERIKRRLGARP